jgi:FkbM family methyltransferase
MIGGLVAHARDALRFRLRRASLKRRNAAAQKAFASRLAALGPGSIVVDCGANVGVISERLARTGATVHAFEPDPEAFAALSARLAGFDNVFLHQAAVGPEAGRATLFASVRRKGGDTAYSASSSLFSESKRVSDEPFAEVRVVDFIDFLRSLAKPPELIKIDIEGSEVALLERMFETGVINDVGAVFVETHEKQLPTMRARTFALIDRARSCRDRINFDWV